MPGEHETHDQNAKRFMPDRVGLRRGSTPLERRADIARDLGVEFLFKREDLLDDLGCGHKVRKLAYVIPDALARGASMLITAGSVPSSQSVAVAAMARQHGLASHLIYTGDHQRVPDEAQGNYLLSMLLATKVTWRECSPWTEWPTLVRLVCSAESKRGETPYVVNPGISIWPGLAGSIELGLELADQLGEFEGETWIVVPAGSGGTALGISAAAELVGLDWRVAGVCISGKRRELEQQLASLRVEARHALELGSSSKLEVVCHEDALGEGYDCPTEIELDLMLGALRSSQMLLDPNYMAKAFLGIRQLVESGEIPTSARVVAVHTGGSLGMRYGSPSAAGWYQRHFSGYSQI